MAHAEQIKYFLDVKNRFPDMFVDKHILDIGSLDINGNNRHLFTGGKYIGLDIGHGKNVDVVCPAHLYEESDEVFDVIISNDCFEHDMFYEKTLTNAVRMLKSGGMFLFTCKTTGSLEHGTVRVNDTYSSPLTTKIDAWKNYYRNVTEEDVRRVIDVNKVFSQFDFSVLSSTFDLRFWGIKR